MAIKIQLIRPDTLEEYPILALLDSGATVSSISQKFVNTHRIPTTPLERAQRVYNADGTPNQNGPITEYATVQMRIGQHEEIIDLVVSNISSDIFLGFEWLNKHNPTIDWKSKDLEFTRCPSSCSMPKNQEHYIRLCSTLVEDIQEDVRTSTSDVFIRAKVNISTELAAKEEAKKEAKTWKQLVPAHYHDFHDVFTKEEFDSLPESREWDHKIELTPGALPEGKKMHGKVYSLTLEEKEELSKFIKENRDSGRIRPSKSRFASSFFFIKKKDGRLRPVQDYRNLNKLTIPNRYPLPLTSDLIHRLRGARLFTKLDVRWGYNNV